MKNLFKVVRIGAVLIPVSVVFSAEPEIPTNQSEDAKSIMSGAYWDVWSPEVQAKIDADIEANRKAGAVVEIGAIPADSEVKVEQISSDFFFGAHIFNFDQLGDKEQNAKYKELYGTLFNSATVAFYWNPFEPEQGKPRFEAGLRDSPEFWSTVEEPHTQSNWRRPATDPVVDYCNSKGIRVQGHPLIWGSRSWQIPSWMFDACLEGEEKAEFDKLVTQSTQFGVKSKSEKYSAAYKKLTPQQLDEKLPKFAENLKALFKNHINQLVTHYGDKISAWDVVNESVVDFGETMNVGGKLAKSHYGIMPANYDYEAFKVADAVASKSTQLSINEYRIGAPYAEQVKNLIERGCRVDMIGVQMHLFNAKLIQDLAAGKGAKKLCTPREAWSSMDVMDIGLPIHMSEITISAPDTTPEGRMMQAIVARNLYRLWFSIKPMAGITWWNTVDDLGAPGEPSMSGLFTRDMMPKASFHALNYLIKDEWRTNLTLKPDAEGKLTFRGFRGNYRISWTDSDGKAQATTYHLK